VTPIEINVDLRALPQAESWQPGVGVHEARR
jgi:hypothetical protein